MKSLTITVPCYNSEKYLERCLDSLVTGGRDVEIIVVNDGSTDRIGEIAEGYQKRFPETVKVIHKQNGGHGSGVNAGLYFRLRYTKLSGLTNLPGRLGKKATVNGYRIAKKIYKFQ